MVEDVVAIDPELQRNALLYREVLAEREVNLRKVWTYKAVATLVTERSRSRLGEGCDVIPVLDSWVTEVRVADYVRILRGVRVGVICFGVVRGRNHSVRLP